MTKDEALKMVIDYEVELPEHVINACKEALEQPEQNYVLICKRCGDDIGLEYVPDEQSAQEPVALNVSNNPFNSEKHGLEVLRNTHPYQWQGLTDDEIKKIAKETLGSGLDYDEIAFVEAIEQALKEKNTP
jgi:hypothetical protein